MMASTRGASRAPRSPRGTARRINIRPERRGLFRAKAQRAGMSTIAYAKRVLAAGSGANKVTKKQAQFCLNASKWKRGTKRKKR